MPGNGNFIASVIWRFLSFEALSKQQLYQLLKLRQEVFVVEQECAYLDLDNVDQHAIHCLGLTDSALIAYARIIPPGKLYTEASSVGRVIAIKEFRNSGLGRKLMQLSMDYCFQNFSGYPIKISAQCYLEKFYESLHFSPLGEPYLLDGIPHREMISLPDLAK